MTADMTPILLVLGGRRITKCNRQYEAVLAVGATHLSLEHNQSNKPVRQEMAHRCMAPAASHSPPQAAVFFNHACAPRVGVARKIKKWGWHGGNPVAARTCASGRATRRPHRAGQSVKNGNGRRERLHATGRPTHAAPQRPNLPQPCTETHPRTKRDPPRECNPTYTARDPRPGTPPSHSARLPPPATPHAHHAVAGGHTVCR